MAARRTGCQSKSGWLGSAIAVIGRVRAFEP